MVKSAVGASVQVSKKSNAEAIKRRIKELAKIEVLVGIPQQKSSRDNGGEINNAELLYIHTHGIRKKSMRDEMQSNINNGHTYSQAYALYIRSHGSPLWASPPRPVIQPAINAYNAEIVKLMTAGMKRYVLTGTDSGLRKAGLYGATVSKKWFQDPRNGWPPNSPITIARKGSSAPLIDTGSMRQAITYVIRKG